MGQTPGSEDGGDRDLRPHEGPAVQRAVDRERAVERGDAVLQARQPAPVRAPRAADAVVADLDAQRPYTSAAVTRTALARAYLATLVSASATTKYAADSTDGG